jgi:prepilin-type processing-associated H-X9-DG protein
MKNGAFKLPSLCEQNLAGGTGDIRGTYVYNSLPYYDSNSNNKAKGKLGKPGRDGPRENPDTSAYGSSRKNITALIECKTALTSATTCHKTSGFNCTYIDGHVRFLATSTSAWSIWTGNAFIPTYGTGWNTSSIGFWCWATFMDK